VEDNLVETVWRASLTDRLSARGWLFAKKLKGIIQFQSRAMLTAPFYVVLANGTAKIGEGQAIESDVRVQIDDHLLGIALVERRPIQGMYRVSGNKSLYVNFFRELAISATSPLSLRVSSTQGA